MTGQGVAKYFVNGPFDVLFVGGLSIATCVGLWLFAPRELAVTTAVLAASLQWVINWPHFSATLFRLYRRRANVAQYPMTAFVVPVVIALGVAGSFASPSLIAPALVKLFILWSPYHFSGQSFGISLIYARRHGVELDGWARKALWTFIFFSFVSTLLPSEVSTEGAMFYGVQYAGLGVPRWMPAIAEMVMYASGALLLAFAARWMFRARRLFPLMVLLPAATQYVWFVVGPNVETFYVFVPLFHSLQYLPIAWVTHLADSLGEGKGKPSREFVLTQTVIWSVVNFVGGAALFWMLPRVASAAGSELMFATGVMLAGVQIHHFFVDGVIWKIRNPRVASPLVSNVAEYSSSSQVSVAA